MEEDEGVMGSVKSSTTLHDITSPKWVLIIDDFYKSYPYSN